MAKDIWKEVVVLSIEDPEILKSFADLLSKELPQREGK